MKFIAKLINYAKLVQTGDDSIFAGGLPAVEGKVEGCSLQAYI